MFIVIKNFSINRIENTASLFTQFSSHLIESFKHLEFFATYIFSNSLLNVNLSGRNRISANEYQIVNSNFWNTDVTQKMKNYEYYWKIVKNLCKWDTQEKVGAFRYFYSDFLINNSTSISKVTCPLLISPRIEQM